MTDDQPDYQPADMPSTTPYAEPAPSPYAQQPQPAAQGGWGGAVQHNLGYQSYQPIAATDQNVNTAHVVIAWVCAVISFGYMLPWAIAATRGKSNAWAVGLINFFTGWTVAGWIVALVMACGDHKPMYAAHPTSYAPAAMPPPGWYPAPDGQGQAYWDGRAWTGHRA